jgi:hypothetical protein
MVILYKVFKEFQAPLYRLGGFQPVCLQCLYSCYAKCLLKRYGRILEKSMRLVIDVSIYIVDDIWASGGMQGIVTGSNILNNIVFAKEFYNRPAGHFLSGFVFFYTISDKFGFLFHI